MMLNTIDYVSIYPSTQCPSCLEIFEDETRNCGLCMEKTVRTQCDCGREAAFIRVDNSCNTRDLICQRCVGRRS